MEERDLLVLVAERLRQLGTPYMVTGSYAVSYYGIPRSTHDVDLVVAVSMSDAPKISEAFSKEFYVSDVRDAVRYLQMFNLIHQETQFKVDCWVLDVRDEYAATSFNRRRAVPLWRANIDMISAEDLIISKLVWYREAVNSVHLNDVHGVLKVQRNIIDVAYIDDWCRKLSIDSLWSEVKKELSE